MKIIERIATVTHTDGQKFNESVCEYVEEMQRNGLDVEIKYQITTGSFGLASGAMIIGRKGEENEQ